MALLEARRLLVQQDLRQEAELAAAAAALDQERHVAEMREQFVAVLGHDLRNPLAAIIAGLALVERDPASARAATVLGMMKQSTARMRELIDNTLDFARTRLGGGLVLQRGTPMFLAPVLEQVVAEVRASHPGHRIHTALELGQPVPCDRDRIGQMVSNLLSNAVLHGDGAKPILVAGHVRDGHLVISVVNGGEPIPPGILDRLFQPFAPGANLERQGLGLGLYIAAEIARAHGGSLRVASTPEQTRFTFEMPLVASTAALA
jgi:sigma-B regulation protein RsbU (phosphoserine phosphatase)